MVGFIVCCYCFVIGGGVFLGGWGGGGGSYCLFSSIFEWQRKLPILCLHLDVRRLKEL